MSDVMLLGVLRLPRECWSADPIFVMQQHGRCMEAADRIEADAETIETLQAEVAAERARRIKAEEQSNFIKAVDAAGLLVALKDIVELADDAMKRANRDGAEYDRAGELAGARAAINAVERAQYPRVEKETK